MVNNRSHWEENLYSSFLTQSEVSSAVYGKDIVAGWNDFETFLLNGSMSNWAVSHNGGITFADKLTGLPTFAAPGITETLGDPGVAVDPADGTFYYSTLANYNDGVTDFSAVAVYGLQIY
jgi:hypothetical protein